MQNDRIEHGKDPLRRGGNLGAEPGRDGPRHEIAQITERDPVVAAKLNRGGSDAPE